VRKVDEPQDAVNHGVAKGNEDIDTAELDAIDENLEELVHKWLTGSG
jgi:hypothetical protein